LIAVRLDDLLHGDAEAAVAVFGAAVATVALSVGIAVASVGAFRDGSGQQDLPNDVVTAVLRGGPYDGFLVELEAGQLKIDVGGGALFLFGALDRHAGESPAPYGRYTFSGSLTADRRAIFVVDD